MTKSCYQSDLEYLPTSKIVELLSSTNITRPPTNPKGGDVYVYFYEDISKKSHCFVTVINLILQEVALKLSYSWLFP